MRVLDLFSGIGGFSLGLERAGMRTVQFVEIEPFCQAVLRRRWPDVPCHGDIRTFHAPPGLADVFCGGFPCQDISSSGHKAGLSGARSGLWAEFMRLIRYARPRFAIMENVADLLARGIGDVLRDLAEIGYDAEWHCIPASFVGLPQARERVWIVAYPDSWGCLRLQERYGKRPLVELRNDDDRLDLGQSRTRDAKSWVRRADDGVSRRLDRLTALGNAVVPQIPEIIGRAIMEAERERAAV